MLIYTNYILRTPSHFLLSIFSLYVHSWWCLTFLSALPAPHSPWYVNLLTNNHSPCGPSFTTSLPSHGLCLYFCLHLHLFLGYCSWSLYGAEVEAGWAQRGIVREGSIWREVDTPWAVYAKFWLCPAITRLYTMTMRILLVPKGTPHTSANIPQNEWPSLHHTLANVPQNENG